MPRTAPTATHRNCNYCGKSYRRATGKGGSLAYPGDELGPAFTPGSRVGRTDNGWLHGAYCGDHCYAAAYTD